MAKSYKKDILTIVPLIFSGLLCIGLFFLLWQKSQTDLEFAPLLQNINTTITYISAIFGAVIMVYLAANVLTVKTNRDQLLSQLRRVTDQMNSFRDIVELLLRSKMWLPGLKEYIDDEYEGLTFFEVKEFYKGKSKLAIEFLQESHNYEDTENLYLELKSLLYNSTRDKRINENISHPQIYDKRLLEKWLEHKCGSGLWYYFGYKYSIYKEALNLNNVYERHQDKIMKLALSIDNEAFEDSSFNEVFLSKLGEYMSNEILPKLYQFQEGFDKKLPRMVRYLYAIFAVLIIFGVLLPLVASLLQLSMIFSIVSVSVIIALVFFIATSFYQFLASESSRMQG